VGRGPESSSGPRVFLKKDRKIKIRKCGNLENGYLPSVYWAGAVGPGTSCPPSRWEVQKNFETPPEGLFANKKSFLFAKRSLRQASRPASGREVPLLMIFVIFFWNLCFTNYLKFRFFSNTRFIRHTLMYAYKILIQFYEEDYGI
jgi:hypothetical protein